MKPPPPLVQLDAHAVYLSPTGRRCRLLVQGDPPRTTTFATLLYDRVDGGPAVGVFADGFVLARSNWHVLRRIEG